MPKSPVALENSRATVPERQSSRLQASRPDPIPMLVHDGDPDQACAHARHQHARGPEALARAEVACGAAGARLTPIRRAVLEALYATHRPLGAYDIADTLATAGTRRLAPITIYRALD